MKSEQAVLPNPCLEEEEEEEEEGFQKEDFEHRASVFKFHINMRILRHSRW
jgi:hypothetical protein